MGGIVFLNLLVGLAGCVYLTFFSLQSVPKGDLIRKVESHVLKTYFHYGGSLSSDAVRGELVSVQTNNKRNIYWNYPDVDPYIVWTDNDTIKIGNQTLNVAKGETYDWRDDDERVSELPRQFSKQYPPKVIE
ncbi:DUF5412 family protein [Priestia filamentosa]|uniref:DUF5412 family protein n=1 Tax=Priestia filamentosa TaxID=1402861 RepID=UPI001FB41944|nr:DUF5412 family protein [Priestia filamentosa]